VKLPRRVLFLVPWDGVQTTEQSIERGWTLNAPQNVFLVGIILFQGSTTPIYAPKPLFGEHLQHISWQPIKLSSQNFTEITSKWNIT